MKTRKYGNCGVRTALMLTVMFCLVQRRSMDAAGGSTDMVVDVKQAIEEGKLQSLDWPTEWRVFGPLPPEFTILPPERLTNVPDALEVDGRKFSPQTLTVKEMKLDLMPLKPAGTAIGARFAAYCFATVECPDAGTIFVNAGVDAFSEWYLDGRMVYSTMDGKQVPLNFSTTVTQGKHVLCVLVQRNRWGWSLLGQRVGFTKTPENVPAMIPSAKPMPADKIPGTWQHTVIEETDALEPASPVVMTEAQEIIEKVKTPVRFANYYPKFRVEPEVYQERQKDGSFAAHNYHVYDGDRKVASFRFAHGYLEIQYLNLNPLEPWNPDLAAPKGTVRSGDPKQRAPRDGRLLFCPLPFKCAEAKFQRQWQWQWSVGKDRTTVTVQLRRLEKAADKVVSTYTTLATIRVDPFCGYVVDARLLFTAPSAVVDTSGQLFNDLTTPAVPTNQTTQTKNKDATTVGPEYVNVLPSHVTFHCTKPFLDWRYERVIYSRAKTEKYFGWINDEPQAGPSDNNGGTPMRLHGFNGFFKDPQGWGQVLAHTSPREDYQFFNMTCHLLQDQHNQVSVPAPQPGQPYEVDIRWRFLNMPPEAVNYVLERVEMILGEFVMVKEGQVRDFESNAREAATASPWSPGVVVTNTAAHSGNRSVEFLRELRNGRASTPQAISVRVDPLPVLEDSASYKLSAWVKVEGEGSTAWLSVDPSYYDKRYSDGPMRQPVPSTKVSPGQGWQKVEVEFTTHDYRHGWSPQPRFCGQLGETGAIHLDDITLTRKPAP